MTTTFSAVLLLLMVACVAITAEAQLSETPSPEGAQIVGKHAIVMNAPVGGPSAGMANGPLIGNGDLGVMQSGPAENLIFYIGKNDFWCIRTQSVMAVGQVRIATPALRGASFRTTVDMQLAEIRGEYAKGDAAIASRAWVDANRNLLCIELVNKGTHPLGMTLQNIKGGDGAMKPTSVKDNDTPIQVGCEQYGGGRWFFSGEMADVKVLDRALSEEEIAKLAQGEHKEVKVFDGRTRQPLGAPAISRALTVSGWIKASKRSREADYIISKGEWNQAYSLGLSDDTLALRGTKAVIAPDGKISHSKIEGADGPAPFKLEEWHEYHLICVGSHLTLKVNGQLVAEVIDDDPKRQAFSGILGLQLHSGPPTTVQFKDIRMKILKPATAAPKPSAVVKPAAGKPAGAADLLDKTLVAWVSLANLTQRGGSALTIQRDDQFDGIVFGEKEAGKWMAGSDFFKRTQNQQTASAAENADAKTLIQMAIVYKGHQISIYRNGEPYASYEASNIDLLTAKDNMAVFGLRHEGAGTGQHLRGSIEDARIYDKALSADEIKKLEPKKESAIRPYAWWTFEQGKEADRMGRFPLNNLDGGAKIEGGRLVLETDGAALIAAARKTPGDTAVEFETPAMPANPPDDWLTYHLLHPGPGGAMPGDPNCAFYWKGLYHLHYIYNHRKGFAFAHVSSKDLVHWTWHPTTLFPKTTGHGMFSGTGFITKEGRPAIIYHGQGSGRNQLAFALDDKLEQWTKPVPIIPKDASGQEAKFNNWDPDCWLNGDTYYAISGGGNPSLIEG